MHEEQLRYFMSAARCGSFSAAARECYVDQSTVSRQIAALERELGTELFLRKGRSLTLTAAGSYMTEMARNYLDQCVRLQVGCRRRGPVSEEPIMVRCGPWEGFLLAEPLVRFAGTGSHRRRFASSSNSYNHLTQHIQKPTPFLAFCTEQCVAHASMPLHITPVLKRPWLVAASVTSPFWQLPAEKQAWLEGQTVILCNPRIDGAITSGPEELGPFEPDCLRRGLRQRGFIHGGILYTQLDMARTGYGVLIVPPWLPEHLMRGLRTEDCLAVPYAPAIVMAHDERKSHPHLPVLQKICLDWFRETWGPVED